MAFTAVQLWLTDWLRESEARILAHLLLAIGVWLVAWCANEIGRRYLLRLLSHLVRRTKNEWDDVLYEQHVFDRFSHLAPALVLYCAAWLYPPNHVGLIALLHRASFVYMTLIGVSVLFALMNSVQAIYSTYEVAKNRPIKGYLQAFKVLLILITFILLLSLVTDRSPLLFLSGVSALTAVLLLIFRDSILGFVAGIQLAMNNMIREGDWIEVPGAGADGDVIDVSLTTVKVQNWNKTITTIPIYSLISGSFTNWRGMFESGGRRIMRSIPLDLTTVRFVDQTMLDKLSHIELLSGELAKTEEKMKKWHLKQRVDEELVNAPLPTNAGLYRSYISAYLHQHEAIDNEMTFLVRQLQPTPEGLPIQIYVFCKDQRWVFYETIQAEIIEHILAMAPVFCLRIYQKPSGHDLEQLGHVSASP